MNFEESFLVAASKIHGIGLFATKNLVAGQTVLILDDSRKVDNNHSLSVEKCEFDFHCNYLANGKVVLLQFPEKHINSSCDSNTF